MTRIFIALPISNELKAKIHGWRKSYTDLPVRWLDDKNLHITIVPPWEERDLPKVLAALRKHAVQFGPQALEFTRTAFGPDEKEPRLIWATGNAPHELTALRESIEKLLEQPITKKDFLQHLTLARFRPDDFKDFPYHKLDKQIHWTETVSEFVVMKSELLSTGAEYTVLGSFPI